MADSQGFWSYVHADDDAEDGRIVQLAKDLAAQFEMLTAEPIALFVDRDAIGWGQNWKELIDTHLATVAFFIPVLTPRYFMSPECRRELQAFARQATNLGIKELVLPVLYVDVPAISGEADADELVKLVRSFQWEDWRELRFSERSSEVYRRNVARLASRLVDVNRQIERGVSIPTVSLAESGPRNFDNDESPGFVDRMASFEEALPAASEVLGSLGEAIRQLGVMMSESTAEVDRGSKQGKGYAFRVAAAKKLARSLSEPAERIWSLGNAFASKYHDVDDGMRALIEQAVIESVLSDAARLTSCSLFGSVRSLATSAHEGVETTRAMIQSMESMEKVSRDLRPVMRRLKQGLTTMVEATELSDEWVRLIDQSGVRCEEVAPNSLRAIP